jgi:hypothetical protein
VLFTVCEGFGSIFLIVVVSMLFPHWMLQQEQKEQLAEGGSGDE